MIELIREYLPVILLAVLIGAIVGFLIFRPRQRVRLTDSAPLRPHMPVKHGASPHAGETVFEHEAEVSTRLVVGTQPNVDPTAAGASVDDFTRMKGVGPRFAEALHKLGFGRFDQLAKLTPEEIDRLDPQLGSFRGRIVRDRVVEQADYLARGDLDGFEQRFGKL